MRSFYRGLPFRHTATELESAAAHYFNLETPAKMERVVGV